MKFTRLYSSPDRPVRAQVGWRMLDVTLRGGDGSVIFHQAGIEVPARWSDNAATILAQKYLRKAGAVEEKWLNRTAMEGMPKWLWPSRAAKDAPRVSETSAHQVFHRLAGAWTYWGWRGGYFGYETPERTQSEENARAFYDEVYMMMALQVAAPNSPQWFNCFSGRETFITREYGVCSLFDARDDNVTVWTNQGWKAATVKSFGKQKLRRVTFAPVYWRNDDYRPCWTAGKTNLRVSVDVTLNHRWPLADGGDTTSLTFEHVVGSSVVRGSTENETYRSGFRHGVIFGDGGRVWGPKRGMYRFRARLCGEKKHLAWAFDRVGWPLCFSGDPLVQVTVGINLKEFPTNLNDHDYLSGFLDGWIATDGSKRSASVRLTTIKDTAEAWLRDNAASAGWTLVGLSLDTHGGGYDSTKPVYVFTLTQERRGWRVVGIEYLDDEEEVFCAIVPDIHEFTLSSGIVTGNCGLHWAYGIEGAANGQWVVDEERLSSDFSGHPDNALSIETYVVQTTNAYERPQPHACFLTPVADDLVNPGGILDLVVREGRIFKHGSGSGINPSCLRAKGEKLSGGGTASGLMSWLRIHDSAAGAIQSGGTTRRAAKMVCVEMDHPEVEDFVTWKQREEAKAAAMYVGSWLIEDGLDVHQNNVVPQQVKDRIAAGIEPEVYGIGYEEEAIRSVDGQNSNNSVRVTDNFLRRVDDGAVWQLFNRTDGSVAKVIPDARDLWRKVCLAAWACADPGVIFDDTVNAWATCPADGRIKTTNPCSEFHHNDSAACNLASLRQTAFLRDDGTIDVETYIHACRLWTVVLDISNSMASFPAKEFAIGAYQWRTLGLGYADLGGLLMRMALPYDSDEGRSIAAGLTALMTGVAYRTSAEMATELGPFPRWEQNRTNMSLVLHNHATAAYGRDNFNELNVKPYVTPRYDNQGSVWAEASKAWAAVMNAEHGFRNAQTTLIAPTGCLVAGTLIATEEGFARIEQLGDPEGGRWQDSIISVQTDAGPKLMTKFYVNGEDDVIETITSSGYRLISTPKHSIKIVLPTGEWVWCRIMDIDEDDVVPMAMLQIIGPPREVTLPPCPPAYRTNVRRGVRTPKILEPKLAEVVGFFAANGSSHEKGLRLAVADADVDALNKYADIIDGLFHVSTYRNQGDGYISLDLNSTQVREWWSAAGFNKSPGDKPGKGFTAHIPDAILASNDPEIYGAYLRGLFTGDGTVHVGLPSLSNKDRIFLGDVQTLMLSLGIPTIIDEGTGGWSDRPMWRVRVAGATFNPPFIKWVGFSAGRKQDLIRLATPLAKTDHVVLRREVIDRVCPIGHELRRDVNRHLRNHGGLSRTLVKQLIDATDDLDLKHAASFYYTKVISTELVGRAPTFDISVPDGNAYLANGFISHNTIALVMDCDTTGVEPDFALVKHKQLAGGGSMRIVNGAVPAALLRLGYSVESINSICDYIERHGVLPHKGDAERYVANDDLSVFATAVGDDFLSPEAHVRMVAAVQPFLSGAVSKTVNLPSLATPDDVDRIYRTAHRLGLKSIAIYRDGSKLTQPLSSSNTASSGLPKAKVRAGVGQEEGIDSGKAYGGNGIDTAQVPANPLLRNVPLSSKTMDEALRKFVKIVDEGLKRGERERLQPTREGLCKQVYVGGQGMYWHTGEYPDGRLGEVFLRMNKEGSFVGQMVESFGKLASIAIQYGTPLQKLVDTFTSSRFEPNGIVERHDTIKMCSSILDLLFRDLAERYLQQPKTTSQSPTIQELEAILNDPTPRKVEVAPSGVVSVGSTVGAAQVRADDVCWECGQHSLVRTGTCMTCTKCGANTGCG